MYETSCKLVTKKIVKDDIGVERTEKEEIEVPIIKIETVFAKEYYEANQAGYRPNLKIRISALNYNNEEEIVYKNTNYSIVRVDEPNPDEITLVCERKIKNVKST